MILIIGSNGQLGYQMQLALSQCPLGESFIVCDYPDIDISKLESLKKWLDDVRPSIVINCAAYTNVDQAEIDYDNAYKINALGPKYLAELCEERNIELVHISTDYVFSGIPEIINGAPRAYIEQDKCAPITVYGKTKLEGERFVQSCCTKHYILRTAWLYGEGKNFVRTMLALSKNSNEIRVVSDQIGSPTSTVDLSNAICALIGSGQWGLYHATCEGQCSWYDFAKKIFELKGINVNVVPVTSEELVRPAERPKWSVLENRELKVIQKNVFRTWEDALKEYLEYNK